MTIRNGSLNDAEPEEKSEGLKWYSAVGVKGSFATML
jgi:hypothetical protein